MATIEIELPRGITPEVLDAIIKDLSSKFPLGQYKPPRELIHCVDCKFWCPEATHFYPNGHCGLNSIECTTAIGDQYYPPNERVSVYHKPHRFMKRKE